MSAQGYPLFFNEPKEILKPLGRLLSLWDLALEIFLGLNTISDDQNKKYLLRQIPKGIRLTEVQNVCLCQLMVMGIGNYDILTNGCPIKVGQKKKS